jgi:hypothetical protein
MRSFRADKTALSSLRSPNVQAYEEILACNLKEVIADLCLVDLDIMHSYAGRQLHGNIDEILAAATELYFKEETISYVQAISVASDLEQHSCIVFDLEFNHDSISVFFKLFLGEYHAGIHINSVLLDADFNASDFNETYFSHVLASARVRPLPPRFRSFCHTTEAVRH